MDYKIRWCKYDNFHRPVHTHDCYQITLYYDGEGFFYYDNNQTTIKKGDILIVPPKTKHFSMSKSNLESVSILGDFLGLINVEKPTILHEKSIFYYNKEFDILKSFSELLVSARLRSKDIANNLCNVLSLFVLELLDSKSQEKSAINKIIAEIKHRFYDKHFNVTHILHNCGYSEDYARTLFKKQTGKSPLAFLTEERISHAKKLLSSHNTNLSLLEISNKCGYSDYIYFTKQFKKITGLSPANYKKIYTKK